MKDVLDSLEARALLEPTTTGVFVAVLERPPGDFVFSSRFERGGPDLRRLIPDNSHRPGPPWLVGPQEWGAAGPMSYEPLAVPDLHRRFAKLIGRPPSLTRFAGRYGFLGLTLPVETEDAPGGCFIAESGADWRYERRVMAHLVEIHDLAQRSNAAGPLTKIVRWGDNEQLGLHVTLTWPGEDSDNLDHLVTIASARRSPQLLERWGEGALVEPARFALTAAIQSYIEGHVRPSVLPLERHGQIVFRADTLLAAMYMQFALEVSGAERPSKLCKGCGKYFIPSRANREYCDPNCKNRSWYRKQHSSGQAPQPAS